MSVFAKNGIDVRTEGCGKVSSKSGILLIPVCCLRALEY